jgi:hypothetical protein
MSLLDAEINHFDFAELLSRARRRTSHTGGTADEYIL